MSMGKARMMEGLIGIGNPVLHAGCTYISACKNDMNGISMVICGFDVHQLHWTINDEWNIGPDVFICQLECV